ncbi:MAG: N-ethylammeline chlorohydrolase, partial [Methanobacterium sp.]
METKSILIDNVTIMGSEIKKGSVLIENDKIIDMAENTGQMDADEIINGEKRVLMPGIVNTHTHLSMNLLRGL